MRPVRMQDIAKEAGVSASTVCRALRSHPEISAETIARIRKIADSLGYRPNPLLSALASRRRGRTGGVEATTIAYVTDFDYDIGERLAHEYPFSYACFSGAKARAEQFGYHLEYFRIDEKKMSGERLSKILYHRGICGVCIAPLATPQGRLSLDWGKFSCAAIGYSLLHPVLHRAATNLFQEAVLAIGELKKLGYQKVGFCINSELHQRTDGLMLAGALLHQHNHSKPSIAVKIYKKDDHAAVQSWFRKERPDAVLAEPKTKPWLEAVGVKIPEQVGFATFSQTSEFADITRVDQRSAEVAAAAVDLVIAQIQRNEQGLSSFPKTTLLNGYWKPGSTTREILRPRVNRGK